MSAPTYNWQQKGWPRFTYNRAHLSDELSAFADAFRKVKKALGLLGLYALTALTRSALEPRLVGRQLGLDPLLTLIALYTGFRLWGIWGMFLMPMLAITVISMIPETRKPGK